MKSPKFWRYALRHCSNPVEAIRLVRFARSRPAANFSAPQPFSLTLFERDITLHFREGTTDVGTFIEVFRDKIYPLPSKFQPQVILDIGANIGMTALYFSLLFPQAEIHSFEPIESNLDILRRNIEGNGLTNVHIHPYGLGDRDYTATFTAPPGLFWGFSSTARPDQQEKSSVTAHIRDIVGVWDELGLKKVDLAKVDCEGAEVAIFKSLGEKLASIELLFGEFHPNNCNAYEALYLLSQSHQVDCCKQYNQEAFAFRASLKKWNSY